MSRSSSIYMNETVPTNTGAAIWKMEILALKREFCVALSFLHLSAILVAVPL